MVVRGLGDLSVHDLVALGRQLHIPDGVRGDMSEHRDRLDRWEVRVVMEPSIRTELFAE